MPLTTALSKAIQLGDINTVAPLIIEEKAWDEPNEDGLKPIHLAVNYGHLDLMDWLLKNGTSLECATIPNGSTPLHSAGIAGQSKIIEHLVKVYQDNPNKKRADGITALYFAAYKGHTETVALLLACGANSCETDNYGISPLFMAAQEGHLAIVTLLLEHHADIAQATHEGRSPLWIAAKNGHTATVALLLEHGADIWQTTNNGVNPLLIAAQNGHTAIVALLLEQDAEIVQTMSDDTLTPLYIAAQNGHAETVALLLEHGADIRQVVDDGTSPLFIAAQEGHTETVAVLLEHDADTEQAMNNEGATPLYIAAEMGNSAMVALLLDHDADINHPKNDGATPLYAAAQDGHTAIVALLLDNDADIQQANNSGISPLYIAAGMGHAETVALLLSRGAPREQAEFLYKRTPLWIAAAEGHTQVVQILLADHALMKPNREGNTPLHIAIEHGHLPVVKLLLAHHAALNTLNAEKQTPLMLAARSQEAVLFSWLLAAWFQQQHTLISSETEHKQDLESKKTQEGSSSPDNYNYADDSYKIVSVIAEQVLPQDISHWQLLPPAALTLAKATRQSLSLELSQEQLKQAVKLGEGAFGEVFRTALPSGLVALKRMKLERMAEWFKVSIEEAQAILQWEISQLEKVRHPHVVELLSVTHSEAPLLAMELCDTTLDKATPKTPFAQWQIAWEVASGLAYLHHLSLVHRDIKPENILLKEGIAKIADMGLAQIDPLLLDQIEPAQLQGLIGDTQWASPEEKLAFKAYHQGTGSLEDIKTVSTAAADIYRYGLVLNTFHQPMWFPIIEACLQPDPKTRPSALQVLAALESNIPHPFPLLAKLCQRLGIFAHHHQHELAHFMIPWVSSKPDIHWLSYQEGIKVKGNQAPQPFTTLWQGFLSTSEKRMLDLRGAGGLGKTLLGYHQLKEHWQALRQWLIKPEGKPPTLVLLLTPDYLPTTAFTLEERLAEIYQLTSEECTTLKEYPVVFLLDGEDEWQARPQLDLSHWPNAKTWIIGRPSATAQSSVYILPFNQVQITNYLRKSLTWDEATTQDFITQLPLSAIKEVLRNPFVLSMFRILWPIPHWQTLTKETIYHTYFTQFIEKQQSHWLTGPYRKIYEELIKHLQQEHPTLADSYLHFAGEVSLQLFEARRLEGKLELDFPWTTMSATVQSLAENVFKEKQKQLLANHEKTHLTLEQYQGFALAHLNRFVMPAPLEFGYYRFRHKSLFEYAWAYSALLPKRPLEEDQALLTTYALIHQKENEQNEEKLDFSIIEASKNNPDLAPQAGNLLTLYNWARLPLAYNYQGAHIENANLAYANLIGADLRGATLTNCYFANACIERTHFDHVLERSPQNNRLHPPLLGHDQRISCSAKSPNRQLLATLDREHVFIWHHHQRVRHFYTHILIPVTALAIDNSGALLIGDIEGYIYFFSGNTRLRKLRAHDDAIIGIECIGEDHCWVGSANDNTIFHRKHYTREKKWRNSTAATCSAFHSLSSQHALGTKNGVVALHSIKEGTPENRWRNTIHQGESTALAFSNTGSHFATGGKDGKIALFETNSKSPPKMLDAANPIKSLHWSEDGQLVIAITAQGVHMWDLSGKEQGNFKATAIQAIFMNNSHEGILIEESGSLYGITLNAGQLNLSRVIAGKDFQGGIAIQPIHETFINQPEEKAQQPDSERNPEALVNPPLQQQGLFAAKNQNAQEQAAQAVDNASQQANEFKQDC